MVSGCQMSGDRPNTFDSPADPVTTGSVSPQDPTVENTQKWAKYWQTHQKDSKAAMSYAAHLRALSKHDQALSVLRKTAMSNPQDTEILAAYGKQLAVMRQFPEANKVLYKATATGTPTWEILSLHGTVLDRLGKHKEARSQYGSALKASPDNPKVVNNFAMSHAISGDPKKAEDLLLKAIAKSAGRDDAQLRQNLALVLGLQGEFERARKVLAKVLPPHQVEANMAYIKKMISQRNTWQQIQTGQPEPKG
jgi:Flp pilus assembly protein TadD